MRSPFFFSLSPFSSPRICFADLFVCSFVGLGGDRISGRASHVSKLRAEFDTGADYDLQECTPGDLDPHAVSSVFKAYLRERTFPHHLSHHS